MRHATTTSGQASSTLEDALSRTLRDRGQRVTSQRLVLHRVITELGRHVSAEEIYDAAAPLLPGLSLPTVYATLGLFEELGLVRRLSLGGDAVLFDPRSDEHHHLSCRRCGRVQDLEISIDDRAVMRSAGAKGFAPDGMQVVVVGLCADCAGAS
jgi:Fur family ferric uptake transcriptional regulator/Fur family peroxide stress response transcriptional regulator